MAELVRAASDSRIPTEDAAFPAMRSAHAGAEYFPKSGSGKSCGLVLVVAPPLSAGLAAFVPSIVSMVLGINEALSILAGIAAALPGLVAWFRAVARCKGRLALAESALFDIAGGPGEPGKIAEEMAIAVADTLRILEEDARRNIDFIGELRESVYRSSAIAGETRILEDVVAGLADGVGTSSKGVEEIVGAVELLGAKVERQAAAMNEIGASIEEMNASIKSIASITENRGATLEALREKTAVGREQLRRLDELIARAKVDVEGIVKMTGAIQDIATMTDLLSMNAAIEAAHAGAAGRGFSVVAKEIRKLSESATRNVNLIVEALARIEKSMSTVHDVSGENIATFGVIGDGIQGFVESFREIGGATTEAAVGTRQIVAASASLTEISDTVRDGAFAIRKGVVEVDSLLASVRSASAKTAATIEKVTENVKASNSGLDGLTAMIIGVRNDMTRIGERIGRGRSRRSVDVPRLMAQHLHWVIKARLSLDGRLPGEAKTMGDHTKCDLGKWMASEDAASLRAGPSFEELDRSHRRLHEIANEIIGSADSAPIELNEERFEKLLDESKLIMARLPGLLG